jgi:exosome complex component MTR3
VLTCYVKFAPFATRHRRGWLRDPTEKDISTQLEAALRGVIIGERYPKTGVDVCITVIEGEEDRWWGDETMGGANSIGGWGLFGVLAGCVTVASAALVDAGIDCVDLVSGGVAAIVGPPTSITIKGKARNNTVEAAGGEDIIVLDPNPTEHENIKAACAVGYIASRDEMTLLWLRGATTGDWSERLIDAAVSAASATKVVLQDALLETAKAKFEDDAG